VETGLGMEVVGECHGCGVVPRVCGSDRGVTVQAAGGAHMGLDHPGIFKQVFAVGRRRAAGLAATYNQHSLGSTACHNCCCCWYQPQPSTPQALCRRMARRCSPTPGPRSTAPRSRPSMPPRPATTPTPLQVGVWVGV
jgi:hypothetical protein